MKAKKERNGKKMKKRNQALCVWATAMLLSTGFTPASQAIAVGNQATSTTNQTATSNQTQQANQTEEAEEDYTSLTPERAAELVGFPIQFPGYIPPEDDYYITGVSYAPKDQSAWVTFHAKKKQPIYVKMFKGDIAKESAGLKETTFSKGKGFVGQNKEPFGDRNVFLWEEEKGVIYLIASSEEAGELRKIADSMGKGDYSTIKKATLAPGFKSVNNLTVEKASEMLGVPIKLPAYPANGEPGNISYAISRGEEHVLIMYDTADLNAFLDIEIKKSSAEDEYNSVPLIDYPNPNGEMIPFQNGKAYTFKLKGWSLSNPELTHFNGFLWEPEEGVVYKLISELPYKELMKIASSIK